MEITDELIEVNRQLEYMIYNEMLLSKIAYAFLCVACLFFFVVALYKFITRRWSSVFFVLLCASAIVWSLLSLLALLAADIKTAEFLNALRYIGIVPFPAFLALHIRLQVSYKVLRPYSIILYLIAPVFFTFIISRDLLFPSVLSFLPSIASTPWYYFLFYLYAIISLVKSYLLCFNVFYQMPPRTRRSTKSTFISVIALTLLIAMDAFREALYNNVLPQAPVVDVLLPLITPIALAFIIYPLFDSMYIMPASDVIVTSREFVMGGLSTTVLVLNLRYQVLDWNRKDWGASFPLPKPKYKEHYPSFLKRVLTTCSGRVSPHNSDIVIIMKDGYESHFLLRAHEVGNKRRMFGYVVEISEVTPIYTKLRYFEEIAHNDTLTGLNNRNAYIDYTQQLLKEKHMPLLVLVGDLNRLKLINDVHGHLAGDELIVTVAKTIEAAKPQNAFLARVGGDEFVLLVPNGSNELAERFINRVNAMCGELKHKIFSGPSVSWGYALMTSVDQSYNDVFKEADKMMYDYKKGRTELSRSGALPEEPEEPEEQQ